MEADSTSSVFSSPRATQSVVTMVEQRADWRAKGISLERVFGIPELDDYVPGFWPGDVIITQALPSCGKSATTRSIFYRVSDRISKANESQLARGDAPEKVVAVWVTTEEPIEKVAGGMISASSGVQLRDILHGNAVDLDRKVPGALLRVASMPVYIIGKSAVIGSGRRNDAVNLNRRTIQAGLDRIVDDGFRIAYIVIDYIQDIEDENPSGEMQDHVLKCVNWIRDIGVRYGCPAHALAQARATVADRAHHHIPGLRDMEWSMKGGQKADIVLGLWMPKVTKGLYGQIDSVGRYSNVPITKDLCFVMVAKYRDGEAGEIFATSLNPARGTWTGMDVINMNDLVNVPAPTAQNLKIEW